MLSGDGTPVLIHDETLERTTDGRGRVADASDAELARLDAGSWHGARFAGEPLPSFGDAAELCQALGLWQFRDQAVPRTRGRNRAQGGAGGARAVGRPAPPLLSSFSLEALAAAREAAPRIAARAAVFRAAVRLAGDLSAPGVFFPALQPQVLQPEECSTRRMRRTSRCCSIPVNDPEDAGQFLRQGVAAIITDRLDLLAPEAA